MTEKETQYLKKRLDELFRKKLDLHVQMRKIDKEIASISNKLEKEIIINEN